MSAVMTPLRTRDTGALLYQVAIAPNTVVEQELAYRLEECEDRVEDLESEIEEIREHLLLLLSNDQVDAFHGAPTLSILEALLQPPEDAP